MHLAKDTPCPGKNQDDNAKKAADVPQKRCGFADLARCVGHVGHAAKTDHAASAGRQAQKKRPVQAR